MFKLALLIAALATAPLDAEQLAAPVPMAWTSVLSSLPSEGNEVRILILGTIESRGYWTDDDPPFIPVWWESLDGGDQPQPLTTHWDYIE